MPSRRLSSSGRRKLAVLEPRKDDLPFASRMSAERDNHWGRRPALYPLALFRNKGVAAGSGGRSWLF